MSQQAKIWIDLTDLSSWSGHFTGIQRLVFEVARRYAEDANTCYFVFDQHKHLFYEVNFHEMTADLVPREVLPSQTASTQGRRLNVKSGAYYLYAKSPLWLKDRLSSPKTKARLRHTYQQVQKRRHIRRLKKASKINGQSLTFGVHDFVLVMGKAWDYAPDFMECLRRQKMETNFKLVQVVYDLMPVYFPHLFGKPLIAPFTQHLFEVAASSDMLLAISESTKRDLQRFCDEMFIPRPTIDVIRLGDDFSGSTVTKKPHINGITPGNFLLCVGTVEARKNHLLLYLAYKEGLNRGVKLPKLVIVGGPGWYTNDIVYQFTHDPVLKDLVYLQKKTSDSELSWLYQNCLFTIYPSVYEGWGLPVAESLLYGKLCLTSNVSSMPEIAGDLIDYFSPYDSGQCLETIVKYLEPETLQKKEAEIAKHYQPTTWDETFEQTVSRLSSITHD